MSGNVENGETVGGVSRKKKTDVLYERIMRMPTALSRRQRAEYGLFFETEGGDGITAQSEGGLTGLDQFEYNKEKESFEIRDQDRVVEEAQKLLHQMEGQMKHVDSAAKTKHRERETDPESLTAESLKSTALLSFSLKSQEDKPGLSNKEALDVYNAKSRDLNMVSTSARQRRAVQILQASCTERSFTIRESGLGPISASVLERILSNNPGPTSLDVSMNTLHDEGAKSLARMLRKNSALISFAACSNAIGVPGCISIFEALQADNRTITSVDLSSLGGIQRNHVGKTGAQALSDVLKDNPVLYSVSLGGNGVGAEGVEALASGIAQSKGLSMIDLSSNNVGYAGVSHLCNAMTQVDGCPLTHLNLSRNDLGDDAATELCHLLRSSRLRLKILDVSHNRIGSEGGSDLGEALRHNRTLQSLILDHNRIQSTGARMIAVAVRETSTLRVLRLGRNEIEADGAKELGEALRKNSSLVFLDIQNNPVGDRGGVSIAHALLQNGSLQHLDISNCKIADQAGVEIATAARRHKSLTNLTLRGNRLADDAGAELASALRENPRLRYLDANFNNINYKQFASMEEARSENLKRHKNGTINRYKAEIAQLRMHEQELVRLRQVLAHEERRKVQTGEELVKANQKLESLQDSATENIHLVDTQLKEFVAKKKESEEECEDLITQISKLKSEKEMKYRAAMAKLQRDTDARARLEKKLRQKELEIDKLCKNSKAVADGLDEQLNLEKKKLAEARRELEVEKERLLGFTGTANDLMVQINVAGGGGGEATRQSTSSVSKTPKSRRNAPKAGDAPSGTPKKTRKKAPKGDAGTKKSGADATGGMVMSSASGQRGFNIVEDA